MVWLIISLLAVIVILLLILLLRKSENGAAELCERGLSSARRDIEESFSRNRLEQQQSSSLQQEMMKSSFAEFMKFLQEFRDAVRQADENSAEKLTGALQSYGDRTDKKTGELIRTLEEKIRLFGKRPQLSSTAAGSFWMKNSKASGMKTAQNLMR